jgi:hypothetical protein
VVSRREHLDFLKEGKIEALKTMFIVLFIFQGSKLLSTACLLAGTADETIYLKFDRQFTSFETPPPLPLALGASFLNPGRDYSTILKINQQAYI